jgi:hypothetical protein
LRYCDVDWLKTKGIWGAKFPNNKKIVAMTATNNALKGQLKLDPKLSAITNKGNKKGNKKGKKKKNKKNMHNRGERKKDEVWKEEPLKDSEKHKNRSASTLTIGVNTTWCGLSTSLLTACWASSTRRTEEKPQKANSATIAADAATSAVNPHFDTLMASVANLAK